MVWYYPAIIPPVYIKFYPFIVSINLTDFVSSWYQHQIILFKRSVIINGDDGLISSQPDFDSIVEMLAREATRKISAIFSQLSSLLHNENKTLSTKVGQLENELKTMTENYENARMWRENVLNGCPVLFEQSGLIFTLKPFGKLKRKTDEVTEGVTKSSPAAGMQSACDAGKFPLNEETTQKHETWILQAGKSGWLSEYVVYKKK